MSSYLPKFHQTFPLYCVKMITRFKLMDCWLIYDPRKMNRSSTNVIIGVEEGNKYEREPIDVIVSRDFWASNSTVFIIYQS